MFHDGRLEADVPNAALTDDAPLYDRPWVQPRNPAAEEDLSGVAAPADLGAALLALLAAPNIANKRWIYRQYDSTVRTNTIVGPGSDAAVVRVKGTRRALAMAVDGNGRYCWLDPFEGARLAVAEACRNVASSGAVPIGATNCLNFGNPEKPEVMGQLVRAIQGIGEACRALGAPITGGNVSLYNETDGRAIYPTPVIAVVGLLEDASRALRQSFRDAGRSRLPAGRDRRRHRRQRVPEDDPRPRGRADRRSSTSRRSAGCTPCWPKGPTAACCSPRTT